MGAGPASLPRLWVLMATVFVDMIGFLMVLPLLPFYAERLGADAFLVGVLVGIFAFAQLATSPLWGKLSDRYGRRPMILIGLTASALAYLLFGLATSIWVLLLSRLVQGAGGGTTGVAQAYISDMVVPGDRAKGLGWLSAATSAGVMVGPAIGSLAAHWGMAAPGFIAAGLCLLNVLFAWRWLPESAPEETRRREGHRPRRPLRQALAEVILHPRRPVHSFIWVYSAGMMAFMAMNGVLALYLERRFGITETTIGWFYVYVGGVSLVMRAVLLGPIVSRFGELRVLRLGALALAVGLLAIPLPEHLLGFGLAMTLIPVGTALLFPATTALVSRLSHQAETGQTLGVQQAFGGVSRMVGPMWAGAAFDTLGIGAPFWVAGGLVLAIRIFTARLRLDSLGGEDEMAAEEETLLSPSAVDRY